MILLTLAFIIFENNQDTLKILWCGDTTTIFLKYVCQYFNIVKKDLEALK